MAGSRHGAGASPPALLDNRVLTVTIQEDKLKGPVTGFVWVTETSDPFFHWQPVAEVAASGQPVVVYSKNLVPVGFFCDNPRVALGLSITGWGGTWLEPGVIAPETMVAHFNGLAEAVGRDRLRLRIDPGIPTADGLRRAVAVLTGIVAPVRTITLLRPQGAPPQSPVVMRPGRSGAGLAASCTHNCSSCWTFSAAKASPCRTRTTTTASTANSTCGLSTVYPSSATARPQGHGKRRQPRRPRCLTRTTCILDSSGGRLC